ncbi:hypothetical protein K493DRAFT_385274, partial [Basidiobolus meristosporus CBS 931.73]
GTFVFSTEAKPCICSPYPDELPIFPRLWKLCQPLFFPPPLSSGPIPFAGTFHLINQIMLQRPRFNSYSHHSQPFPTTEEHGLERHESAKRDPKTADLKVRTSIPSSVGIIGKVPLEETISLNRKTSKIRRFSAILNKKLNRNRLSRGEQISPPVLVTSSSSIRTTPIQKPAKELVNPERASNPASGYNRFIAPSHGTDQLSRQSSKSSTRTQQSQSSEKSLNRLDSQGLGRHRGFLSGGSLSSFTSSGSSDKHSSFGIYSREKHQSLTYSSTTGSELEERPQANSPNQHPDPTNDTVQLGFSRDLPSYMEHAENEHITSMYNLQDTQPPLSPAMTRWEEAALAQREPPSAYQYTMLRNTSGHRPSDSCCFPKSPEWADIKTNERAMSDYGGYSYSNMHLYDGHVHQHAHTNSIKSRRREAVVYAKESETHQPMLFEKEASGKFVPVHPEEASILEYLSTLQPSNPRASARSGDRLENDSFSTIPEEDEDELYHESIIDLYDYESDEETEESTQLQATPHLTQELGTDPSYTSLTELIEKLNRISTSIC